jgi:hypothetical protein
MKLLSWNCKGISRTVAVHGLRALIRANNPNILFLSETKSSPSLISFILNRLGYYSMTHVAPIGSCGGLVLAWRLGVELECFLINRNNISAWYYSDPPNNPWIWFCLVYMVLLKLSTSKPFGILSLLLVRILLALSCALVTSILCLINLKSWEAGLLLAPLIAFQTFYWII